MNTLPYELVQMIIKYSPLLTIVNLKGTCRAFSAIKINWPRAYSPDYYSANSHAPISKIKITTNDDVRKYNELNKLGLLNDIDVVRYENFYPHNDGSCKLLLSDIKCLQIGSSRYRNNYLPDGTIEVNKSKLETLIIRCTITKSCIDLINISCTTLTSLEIGNISSDVSATITPALSSLRKLYIMTGRDIYNKWPSNLTELVVDVEDCRCPTYSEIMANIHVSSNIGSCVLQELPDSIKKLVIKIDYIGGCSAVIDKFPRSLVYLNTDQFIGDLFTKLPTTIKHIKCIEYNDEQISRLVNLRTLQVGNDLVKVEGTHVVSNLPHGIKRLTLLLNKDSVITNIPKSVTHYCRYVNYAASK